MSAKARRVAKQKAMIDSLRKQKEEEEAAARMAEEKKRAAMSAEERAAHDEKKAVSDEPTASLSWRSPAPERASTRFLPTPTHRLAVPDP